MIEGDVTFETVVSPISSATLFVRIQDVSRADAPSIVVAEVALRDISLQPGRNRRLPFRLDAPALDPRGRYNLMAHLDVDNSGAISAGDYLTMESVPVGESGPGVRFSVPARPVS